jgi:hypothetical protein
VKGYAVISRLIHSWDLRKVSPDEPAKPFTPVQFRPWPPPYL